MNVTIKDTVFFVRSMSNDDLPASFNRFISRLFSTAPKPAVIAALCPKFKKLQNFDQSDGAIDETLQSLRQGGYDIFFWVIEQAWEGTRKVSQKEIAELRHYGHVEVFEGNRQEYKSRARRLRTFVSDVVLAA